MQNEPMPRLPRRYERAATGRRAPSSDAVGSAFTAITKVLAGDQEALSSYLTTLGGTIRSQSSIDFSNVTTVHFMRWVVVSPPADHAAKKARGSADTVWLAFETNYDGALEDHLRELWTNGAQAIHTIYGHCEGYPLAEKETAAATDFWVVFHFLRRHSVPSAAFFAACPGKTVERTCIERKIRNEIETFIDVQRAGSTWEDLTLAAMYDAILAHLATQGLLQEAQEKQAPPPPPFDVAKYLRVVAGSLLLVSFPLWGLLYLLYLCLRAKELSDPEDAIQDKPNLGDLAEREDFQVQNQLTHVVSVKRGVLRQVSLRLVLWAIGLAAKHQFNQGSLGGITTIHFARWAFMDRGKRLLFFSNYDGSWENYLGEFIDRAAIGLTGVWSNTVGFPRTKNLFGEGATDEERFKSWTRMHQIPTQLWYSAYPDLTVQNIRQNSRICEGLAERPATDPDLLAWFATL